MRVANIIAAMLTGVIVACSGVPVTAHSLQELQAQLSERERYFQPLDREAPDFALQDADGRPVRLDDFRGKVLVLHFVYANCPDVCPLHAERLAEVQEMANATPMREQVAFVTVTTDPERDLPEVMREYGELHGLDAVNWMLLTRTDGEPEDATRRLAEAFGHKFTRDDEGYQMHGVVTHVIDTQGRWRANFHGLEFQATSLVIFINALANDRHPEAARAEPGFWSWVRGLF